MFNIPVILPSVNNIKGTKIVRKFKELFSNDIEKTISDLKKTLGNLEVNLTFSTIPGATSYQIYRSTSKTGKYTKIGTTNENNYSDTKVIANKTYYYKVRSYLSKDGKNYYSSFSNIVSAKAKEME